MKKFRTLEMAIEFYKDAEANKVTGNLRDQLLRASSSIALNLSEGNAKFSVKEKKRFYQIAYASLKETQTILKLIQPEDPNLIRKADHLGASLFKLMQSRITEVIKT